MNVADSKPGTTSVATTLVGFALCALIAVALRLYHIDSQSIWFDEGWSAFAAAQPTLIDAFNADATNPPLYYGLLHIAARFFGTSEFSLRFMSLLFGLPVIALTYQLAKQAAGQSAGLLAMLLTTFSAPLWWASQEARMYTLLALLVAICALAWQQLSTKPTRAAWIALWLAELALLYAHNTGPVIVLWLNVITLIWWIARRNAGRPDWRVWFGGQIVVGLLYLPYFVTRFLLLSDANSAVQSAPRVDLVALWQVWQGMWIAPWSFSQVGNLLAAGLVALISVLALASALRKQGRWLMLQGLLLTVFLIVGLVVLGNELHGRYLVMIVPLITAAVGAGLARVPVMGYGSIILAVLLFAVSFDASQNPLYGHDDVRGMVQYYDDSLTADDTVLAWSYADRYDLAYYWDRLDVSARRVTLPEGADLDAILQLIPASGRIALNVWYTQRADYRGMMGCLLAHGANTHPVEFTTYGMTNLLYEHAPDVLPVVSPVALRFMDGAGQGIAQVESIGGIPDFRADQSLCVPLALRLDAPPRTDFKAALIVRNLLGWEVSRADAIFATANQRTTAQLAAGERVAAFPLLQLPFGAPAGMYTVYLRLYDEAKNASGYVPLVNDESVVGRDILLGEWQASTGEWQVDDASSIEEVTLNEVNLLPSAGSILRNGDPLRVTLIWRGNGETERVTLRDSESRWQVESSTEPGESSGARREWHELVIPASAASGSAILFAGETEIARYIVESAPMLTEIPAVDHAVDAEFTDVGRLVGAVLPEETIAMNTSPVIILVWQGGETASGTSYTVFVQLVDSAGQVIAQSDALPAAGSRPTTGWREGEYILDEHTLTFNDRAAPGQARLFAGMYDANTGQRVTLADGSDFVVIAENIEVR